MNWLLKIFTWKIFKKVGEAFIRNRVAASTNKIDDSFVAIYDKIEVEDYDVSKELAIVWDEILRLKAEHDAKKESEKDSK